MATRTKIELATAVMRKMGLVDTNDSISGTHIQFVIDEYEDIHAELVEDERAYWEVDEIPVSIFSALVKLVINEVQPAFGFETTLEAQEQRKMLLMKTIIRHVRARSSGLPTKAVYF